MPKIEANVDFHYSLWTNKSCLQDSRDDIHDMTSLLKTKDKIEKSNKKKRQSLPQCNNFQAYGQIILSTMMADVFKCGKNQQPNECTKEQNSPAKCPLH